MAVQLEEAKNLINSIKSTFIQVKIKLDEKPKPEQRLLLSALLLVQQSCLLYFDSHNILTKIH